ncbi:3410_t:CDS:2, partial [Funneliformis caledonium]
SQETNANILDNLFLASNNTDERVGDNIKNKVEEEKTQMKHKESTEVWDNDDFIANISFNLFLISNDTDEKVDDGIIESKSTWTQVKHKESTEV